MGKSDYLGAIRELVLRQRWAALATVDAAGLPGASMVAYAVGRDDGCLYLHLSGLAAHTRALLQQPAAALLIGECDRGEGDPQQLPRLTLRGRCRVLGRDEAGYEAARSCYLERLPEAAPRFAFADFRLFGLVIEEGRFVGGFGQAHSYSGEELCRLLQQSPGG